MRLNNVKILLLISSIFLIWGCTHLFWDHEYEEETLIVPVQQDWYIPYGPKQTLRERTWDLHHQKLWVRFDFSKEQVLGKTELLFTSKQPQSTLTLDAKTMRIDSVYALPDHRKYTHQQDSAVVTIELEETFTPGDTLIIAIDFVSFPPERGLYFVNADGKDPVKPTQVWTLGQPEDNSFWFPTIDHPAERMTQEVWISVPPRFSTLSNGLLKKSEIIAGDSLRTDYWKLSQPHAPYLLALAVGEFEIIEEIRDGYLYRYYIEPEYAPYVHLVYENTVEMIRFSENVTGVPYPWDPIYSQAPVHNYIARGMENTTATILYDGVQFNQRMAPYLCNQDLLLHEVIHQWFGNLITAKDWANLPLNEGFANYYESQFRLHTSGYEEYLWKNQQDRIRYFNEADVYRRPVIFDQYDIPEDMYDRHTYQKAGQILRMLNDYLGEERWDKAIQLWFERYSFQAVDIFDLLSVVEEAAEEPMDWFFNQWFLEPGHPSLVVSTHIDGNVAVLSVTQVQDTTQQPVFQLNPNITFTFKDGSTKTKRISTLQIENEYHFRMDLPVKDILFDPERIILAEYIEDIDDHTIKEHRLNSEHLLVRSESIGMLTGESLSDSKVKQAVIDMTLDDPFWGIRMLAIELLADNASRLSFDELLAIARHAHSEERHELRMAGLDILFALLSAYDTLNDNDLEPDETMNSANALLYHFIEDESDFVISHAIRIYTELYGENSLDVLERFSTIDSYQHVVLRAVTDALITLESQEAYQLLMELASTIGDLPYTLRALRHLTEQFESLNQVLQSDFSNHILMRINDPVSRHRLWAYEAAVELELTDAIPLLEERKNDPSTAKEEANVLKKQIRALEYLLELNES
ncbi:M1 family aminopeptidase [Balneolaceae bacterium ANBcel3]|nr:M1 family aminopeptidase [Balneolaceae bacterium ANBcel3]